MIKKIEIDTKKTPKMLLRRSIGNTHFSDIQSLFFTFSEYESMFDKFIALTLNLDFSKEEELSKKVSLEFIRIAELDISDTEKRKEFLKTIILSLNEITKFDIFIEEKNGKDTEYFLWNPWNENLFDFCKRNKKKGESLFLNIERKTEDKKIYYNEHAVLILISLFSLVADQELFYKESNIILEAIKELSPIMVEI